MYGKFGSLIARSVCTVSSPFHPFGGAVDIVVVQQQDDSFKSSPWNVRFGKFQGVLKARETVVNISVNGVEAGFHMYLDSNGEAYFLRNAADSDIEEGEFLVSAASSGDEREVSIQDALLRKSKSTSCEISTMESNVADSKILAGTISRRGSIIQQMFGRRTIKDKDKDNAVDRVSSLERADIAAELLDTNWSHGSRANTSSEVKDCTAETKTCNWELDVSVIQTSRMEDGSRECTAQSANFHTEVKYEVSPIISDYFSKTKEENTKVKHDENISSSTSVVEIGLVREDVYKTTDEEAADSEFVEKNQFQFSDTESFTDTKTMDVVVDNKAAGTGKHDKSDGHAEEREAIDFENKQERFSDLPRPETTPLLIPGGELNLVRSSLEAKSVPNLPSHIHDLERFENFQLSRSQKSTGDDNGVDPVKSTDSVFLDQEPECSGDSKENSGPPERNNDPVTDDKHTDDHKVDPLNPFAELSLCRHLLSEGMGVDTACKAFDAEKITLEEFRAMKESLIRNNKLVVRISGRYFPWDAAAHVVLGMVSFHEGQVFESQDMIKVESVEPSTEQGGWRIWPSSFRRTRTISAVQPVCQSIVESSLPIPAKESDGERSKPPRAKRMERKVRSFTPTSEELASLDLGEGKNIITFTFLTSMLGRQQVAAHIYLWKWNTRIVISDVDGTITKSDVLGQFMPMVGVDWSQNGVAHLFSAIKENGYQLLFLSARSISQAHLTRQFLFNLKQDGKTLPDGPVVISPDGLFPSLYREVIRRAPHEFKISCLEAIKALFPPDSHPFYAGFGNRDTDELSYLKVGIPMGKIFIINPKGEVAVNRRVDTRSYTSLHALVNGMFPPLSISSEQEDYNTWNYWKMPLPTI